MKGWGVLARWRAGQDGRCKQPAGMKVHKERMLKRLGTRHICAGPYYKTIPPQSSEANRIKGQRLRSIKVGRWGWRQANAHGRMVLR